jgi:ubiquinone/menaquinone biosynthesis C-methylase UbiE
MRSFCFDRMARIYDATRSCDPMSFNAAIDFLTEKFPPNIYKNLFEPGIGSGRVAIPLAKKGYCVFGVDISSEMLKLLYKKVRMLRNELQIHYELADVCNLPYSNERFDATVAVHLFYFISEWKRAADEILRVTKGPVILIHTGTGYEIPDLNERYKEICAKLGYLIRPLGCQSTNEVADYYKLQGCAVGQKIGHWNWTSKLHLQRAFSYLKSRAYSFTTIADDKIHLATMNELERELLGKYGTLETFVDVPNEIYITTVHK